MEEGKLAGTAAGISLGRIKNSDGEKYLGQAGERLRALRLGPYGDDRYESKEKIIRRFEITGCKDLD